MNHVERRRAWFARGVELGATHLIVKTDMMSFPFEDFPDYAMPGQSVEQLAVNNDFERVSFVYDLKGDVETQMRDEFGD